MVYAPLLAYSGFLSGTGLLLGAYGVHGLQTADEKERLSFISTARHQVTHGMAALVSLTLAEVLAPTRPKAAHRMTVAASLFLIGITISAGTRYVLACGAPRAMRRLGPVGGLTMATGWFTISFAAFAL